ncbi:MAG TPA: hypothetical protein VN643_25800 [Pyrinomonadaceae bacterium]|nr:hypothetical protein [Pyrinomonadaceae bacterium]
MRLKQSNRVIAGTARGQIFWSDNAGASWNSANGDVHGEVNYFVEVNDLLFAATDDGLFRSADRAVSWVNIPIVTNKPLNIAKVMLFKNDLLAASKDGLFRSDPNGQSWAEIKPSSAPADPHVDFVKVGFPAPDFLAISGNTVLVSDGDYLLGSEDLRSWRAAERDKNPIGLLYSMYAPPSIRISNGGAMVPPPA